MMIIVFYQFGLRLCLEMTLVIRNTTTTHNVKQTKFPLAAVTLLVIISDALIRDFTIFQ